MRMSRSEQDHPCKPWSQAWVATAYAALDVHGSAGFIPEAEILVLPTVPGTPLALSGCGAALWRRMVNRPVAVAGLDPGEREIAREMEEMGLASSDHDHPDRVVTLSAPWLESPMHELVYALAAKLAWQRLIPMVFIKGPMLHAQGLRQRRHSADVDAWVQYEHVDALSLALREWGWTRRPATWVNHSVTLFPGEWGCEIDLHHGFPGMSLARGKEFMALRHRSETATFAGTDALAPTKPAAAVLSALHACRPSPGGTTEPAYVDDAVRILRAAGEESLVVAHELGATAALAPALSRAFPHAELVTDGALPANWAWRLRRNRVAAYALALRASPLRTLPKRIWRTVWPRPEEVIAADVAGGHDGKSVFLARGRRLRALMRTARRR